MNILTWVQRAALVLVALTFVAVLVAMFQASIVPLKYVVAVFFAYSIAIAVLTWLVLRIKLSRVWQIALVAVMVVMIAGNAYAVSALRATGSFVNAIQDINANYVDYAIIARKDQPITVESAKTAGIITADPLLAKVKDAAKDETSAQQRDYPELTSLTEGMKNGRVELGIVREASLNTIADNYAEFYQTMTVLRTFRVKTDQVAPVTADVSKPFIVYISGIDTYGSVSETSRSDVNMMMVVNPNKRTMLLVNTPRDYYVQLHGTTGTRDKLTHAGMYGVNMSRQTMEDLYGQTIPYYVRLNFSSLVKMIDTIGPITVHSDYAFKSFVQGSNTLDSKRALEFARERYSFEEGDRQRGKNQQLVIEAIIAKLSEPQTLVRYNSILDALQGVVQTNMGKDAIASLARMQLNDLARWQVKSISVDGSGAKAATYSMGSLPLYVMQPDQASLDAAKANIATYLQQ